MTKIKSKIQKHRRKKSSPVVYLTITNPELLLSSKLLSVQVCRGMSDREGGDKNTEVRGEQNNRTAGMVFALHKAD